MSRKDIQVFSFEENGAVFDDLGSKNGSAFWLASNLMIWLGYKNYATFIDGPVNKATSICTRLKNICVSENFTDFRSVFMEEEIFDYRLSKFACYLIVMNSDFKKPQVAKAHAYFSALAEAFDRYVQDATQIDRINIRGELSEGEKSLNKTAANHGVENYAFFQNKDYLRLYNMTLKEIKEYKGTPVVESQINFAS